MTFTGCESGYTLQGNKDYECQQISDTEAQWVPSTNAYCKSTKTTTFEPLYILRACRQLRIHVHATFVHDVVIVYAPSGNDEIQHEKAMLATAILVPIALVIIIAVVIAAIFVKRRKAKNSGTSTSGGGGATTSTKKAPKSAVSAQQLVRSFVFVPCFCMSVGFSSTHKVHRNIMFLYSMNAVQCQFLVAVTYRFVGIAAQMSISVIY